MSHGNVNTLRNYFMFEKGMAISMLCPESTAASVTALAVALSEGRGDDELALLGALFTQLGDTLATISATRAIMSTQKEKSARP